jgi:hypothetical protein
MNHPVWKFESDLTNRLLVWSVFSLLAGLYLWFTANEFGRGFGIQAAAWGTVDAVIAVFGARSAARRESTADPKKEALFIRKVLWVNFGLDILYVISGGLISTLDGSFWQGTGWGIVLQGSFLFFFDLFHAIKTPVEVE